VPPGTLETIAMRCSPLFAALLLAGCSGSGFWRYEKDTFTLPWRNPNEPVSGSENFNRARFGMKSSEAQPMLSEAGDIWPGPPAPVPTLKELQKQQLAEINNQNAAGTTALAPLPTLPPIPGYEISTQEAGRPAPPSLFSNGSVAVPGGRRATTNYGAGSSSTGGGVASPAAQPNGNLIVPNGNGTSTVITPTGQVTTIPTSK
jgi:hypothetical protein